MKSDNQYFHLLIVDQSQRDVTALKRFEIISQTTDEDWVIYKLSVRENNLKDAVKFIQSNMNEGNWYFHAYNEDGSKLIIVFKNKVFQTDNNPKHWNTVINYGVSQGTPKEQLDFSPNTFADETY
jgi:hypothetical protein